MGYEYGYSLTSPKTLCIWEAQFGDFSNGAQIMIDQYFSAAKKVEITKWFGFIIASPDEGQGANSCTRMERYCILCKRQYVCCKLYYSIKPFHLLRRKMVTTFRKPLVILLKKVY